MLNSLGTRRVGRLMNLAVGPLLDDPELTALRNHFPRHFQPPDILLRPATARWSHHSRVYASMPHKRTSGEEQHLGSAVADVSKLNTDLGLSGWIDLS